MNLTLTPRFNPNWSLLLAFLIALILMIALNSCKAKEPCITSSHTKDSIVYKIREKKVPYFIKDSFPYFLPNPCADLCDSLGKLKQTFVAQIKGKNGSNLSLKVKDNKLFIEDKTVSDGTVTLNDTTVNHFRETKEQLRADCKLEHLSKWDSFWIRVGQILSIIVGVFFSCHYRWWDNYFF